MKQYRNEDNNVIAYPLGGIGAGTVCLTGWGSLESISLRHSPNKWFDPILFSTITLLGEENVTRVLEAKVPKVHYYTNVPTANRAFQLGTRGRTYGLPRFMEGMFSARFPFAKLELRDDSMPVEGDVIGWSPFVPGNADDSSYPFAALEYTFRNVSDKALDAVYAFNSMNFVDRGTQPVKLKDGFAFVSSDEKSKDYWSFSACIDNGFVDDAWYRSSWWFDELTMQWNQLCRGLKERHGYSDPEKGGSPGASVAVKLHLEPGQSETVKLRLCWFVPNSRLRIGQDDDGKSPEEREALPTYRPWYVNKAASIREMAELWQTRYEQLRSETAAFTEAFWSSTLPDEILDAVSANLCILKSPTVLRQDDGRLWCWEGCNDDEGCCHGSCTHVWNYAQAICHLFPDLERSLRNTEFWECQDETGHQEFRAYLPIRPAKHLFWAAADGQMGGIIKVFRDWRICGDDQWLKKIWPRVRQSMEYCIGEWDPERRGVISRPHHNTYDIEFYGPDSLCMSFYISALKAAQTMAETLGETTDYGQIYQKAREYFEKDLFNGEYFYQKVGNYDDEPKKYHSLCWTAPEMLPNEVKALTEKQGPPYQYGTGCLSDSVLGIWLGELAGLKDIVDSEKLATALQSIVRYNYRKDFRRHANPQRAGYASADDAGLLLCSWPKGGKPDLPFVYSDEVWSGIEYQVSSHLLMHGHAPEALQLVRSARSRYDGKYRNPFSEYECGEWYGRALASYALIEGYTGVRYDAVTKTLYASKRNSEEYWSFLACEGSYGIVVLKAGALSYRPIRGDLPIEHYVITD